MPWKSEIAADLVVANDRVAELEAEVGNLRNQLDRSRNVGRVATAVEAEFDNPVMQAAMEEDALSLATVAVIATERERLTEDLSERMQQEKYDDIAATFRLTEGPRIRSELDELLETDGTYDSIRRTAEVDVTASLQGELLDSARVAAVAELGQPEVKEAIVARLAEEVGASEEMAEYRDGVRRKNEAEWREKVHLAAMGEIDAEELARRDAFAEEYKAEYLGSDYMTRYRREQRETLEYKWREATAEEVMAQIQDEELKTLLAQKAEIHKEALRRETQAQQLLQAFSGHGLDTTKLDEGMRLEIFLGRVKEYQLQGQDRNGYNITEDKPGVECQRKMTLVSLGEGRFMVDDDSLLRATSEYALDNALKRGTVIILGRRMNENGETTLLRLLAADVPLYYDDDTEVPDIIDARYPVANIAVDGVSARKIEHVEMVGVRQD